MSVEEEFAKELAKQLPVGKIYDDAASTAAKQTGQFFGDVIKAVQLALAPVQYVAALQDRYRAFLDKAVRRVPERERIAPPPQIIGPVLEGIRYEAEDTPIDQMFSELLSRAMDQNRIHEAHPAYPILIRQLSPDEARILARLEDAQFDYIYTRDYDSTTNLFVGEITVEKDLLPRDGLAYGNNIPFYFEHLNQLGLAGIFQVGNQEPLYDGPPVKKQIGIRVRCKYRLTEFGTRFVRTCVASPRQ